MSFNTTLTRNGTTVVITLDGELDASTAAEFGRQVDLAAKGGVERLVLDMSELTYLSSAGLRGLVFARQKMADGVTIVLVQASDEVERTIRMVGFHHSVVFADHVPE
ncbi:STAS domain-containing protein [Actinoplanes sp. NPDC049681]|uniref:STAS domain-containing protein n=1 Tax=Actinoplanes sp. NPDC049681 TaxID=3363905 RepID=UPI0037AB5B87